MKYLFMYAKDVSKTPQPGNTETVEFRSRFGFWWYLLRHETARAAVRADRFRLIKVQS